MRNDLPAWAYALACKALGWKWCIPYEQRSFVCPGYVVTTFVRWEDVHGR